MIISLSGRKGSGKTTLADYLVSNGFERISFASELKRLVSELYGLDSKDLYDPIKKEEKLKTPLIWNIEYAKKLKKLINSKIELNSEFHEFYTIRHALQYIGTEVLRKYDNDFHVKSIKKYIKKDKNYVLDDVRFINEVSFLKNLGAICIYVIRPYNVLNYSNHESEIQLNRNDFDNIIINNNTRMSLIKKFKRFEKYLFRSIRCNKGNAIIENLSKEKLISLIKKYNTTEIAEKYKCSRDAIVWWCNRYLIHVDRNKNSIDDDSFLKINKESAYWAGLLSADGCIKKSNKNAYVIELASNDIELINGFRKFLKTKKRPYLKKISKQRQNQSYLMTINSPFIIDDMKLWNIEPRKSKYNKIPDCLRNNDELFKYWLVGLIDGDGSISISTNKKYNSRNIKIVILASKEIVEYVDDKFRHIGGRKYKAKKNIDNLYNLIYHGKKAVMLYNEIYSGVGLKRKWDKMKPFLKKKWLN